MAKLVITVSMSVCQADIAKAKEEQERVRQREGLHDPVDILWNTCKLFECMFTYFVQCAEANKQYQKKLQVSNGKGHRYMHYFLYLHVLLVA